MQSESSHSIPLFCTEWNSRTSTTFTVVSKADYDTFFCTNMFFLSTTSRLSIALFTSLQASL